MTDKRISALPEITTIGDTDLLTTVRPGDPANTKNKKITGANAKEEFGLNKFYTMGQPSGFENLTDSEILYNSATQQITIQPKAPATSFNYYLKGIKYNISTPQIKTHTNDYGVYYLYWDAANTLQFTNVRWNLVTDVPISYVIYNLALVDGFSNEDRHSATRNPVAHNEFHNQIGTYIISGFVISGYTVQPATPTDADNTYGLALGLIADEDLHLPLDALPDAGPYTLLYRIGSAGRWYWDKTKTVPYFGAGTYIEYNEFTGATWQLTELANNNYVNYYAFKVPAIDGTFQTIIIPSQQVHTTLNAALGETVYEAIQWGVMPFEEIAPLYKVTFSTSAAYTSTGKCRIESEPERLDGTRVSITILTQLNHNSLSGLQLAGAGVTWGHISDGLQSIYGNKQFHGIVYTNIITSLTNGIFFKNDLAQDVLFLDEDKSSTFYGSLDINSTDFLKWASGTTGERPGTPVNGMVRYNSTTGRNEFFENGAWENYLTESLENLWDRVGTILSPHNAGDDVDLGAGDLIATDLYPSGIMRFTGGTVELRSGTAPGTPFAKIDPSTILGSIYFGRSAMPTVTGTTNSGFGNFTLYDLTTGTWNTAGGHQAGYSVVDGDHNTCFGGNADVLAADAEEQASFGYNAIPAGDYSAQIGNALASPTKIGKLKYRSQDVCLESWIDTNDYFAYIDATGNFVKGDQQLLTTSNVDFNQGVFATKLGIGITPTAPLEVFSSTSGALALFKSGTGIPASTASVNIDTTDAGDQSMLQFLKAGGTEWQIISRNQIDTPNNRLSIYDETTEVVQILQGGLVKIKPQVSGVALTIAMPSAGTDRDASIKLDVTDLDDSSSIYFTRGGSNKWAIKSYNEHSTPNYRLSIADIVGEKVTFLQDGNVGIGTTNPATQLDILSSDATGIARFKSKAGITNSSATVIIDTTDVDDQAMLEFDKSGTRNWLIASKNEGTGVNDRLAIYNATTEVFTILQNGRVGIDEGNPPAMLYVAQKADDAAIPTLTLHQEDISEGVINFKGGAGLDRGIIPESLSSVKSVRVEVAGVVGTLAIYADQ